MGYPYQPPVPGYGPPGYPPMGYPAPQKPKMRKGPAIAAGIAGILAGLASLTNIVLLVVELVSHDLFRYTGAWYWVINGLQSIVAIGMVVLGGICLARRRVVAWVLCACAVLGLLLLPLDWVVEHISPIEYFKRLFEFFFETATWTAFGVTIPLTFITAVSALIAALSRELAAWPAAPMAAQQYPPAPR